MGAPVTVGMNVAGTALSFMGRRKQANAQAAEANARAASMAMEAQSRLAQAAYQDEQAGAMDEQALLQEQQAEAQAIALGFQAAQYAQQAGQERASAQRGALNERKRQRLAMSRALALGAASGGGADPGLMSIIGDIVEEGEFRFLSELYAGEERGRGLEMASEARAFEAGETRRGGAMLAGSTRRMAGATRQLAESTRGMSAAGMQAASATRQAGQISASATRTAGFAEMLPRAASIFGDARSLFDKYA